MAVDEAIRVPETTPSRVVPHLSEAESKAKGKEARVKVPRDSHATFEPAPDRPDPVSLARGAGDDPGARAGAHPLRAHAGLPLHVLPRARRSSWRRISRPPRARDCTAQICGDAHLSNFGVFGSPERQLVFDCNDFDETLPGPWEWDVKRLAASVVIAGRGQGFAKSVRTEADPGARARCTASRCARWPPCRNLEVWYSHVDVEEVIALLRGRRRQRPGSKAEARMAATADKAGRQGADQGQHEGARQADHRGRRRASSSSAIRRSSCRSRSSSPRSRASSDGRPVPRPPAPVPPEPADRPPAPARAVPVQPAGPQGGRGGQRRHPGLDHPAARAPTTRTSCSCRPRRPRRRSSSASPRRARTATTAPGSSPASASCRPAATSSSGGSAPRASTASAATTTCASCRTGRGRSTPRTHGPAGTGGLRGALCACTLARAHARSGDRIAMAAYLGQQPHLREGAGQVRRVLRRPERAGLRGVRRSACRSGRLHAEEGI